MNLRRIALILIIIYFCLVVPITYFFTKDSIEYYFECPNGKNITIKGTSNAQKWVNENKQFCEDNFINVENLSFVNDK